LPAVYVYIDIDTNVKPALQATNKRQGYIMKRKRIIKIVALAGGLGVIFLLAGTDIPGGLRSNGKAPAGQYEATVQRMNLEEAVTALGKLEPATYVDVGAQTSGQLLTLHVELGALVEKGELLAEIDPRTHLAKVEADKATLANLEANLAERQAQLVQAERNYKRDSALRRQNAASELSAQTSETEFKVAKAQVAAIEAQILQAKANLDSDNLNLSYTRIYAPISGTVVSLDVKEGQTLNSSQTAPTLMRMADLTVMTVWASVSEADINKLRPGMDVYFTTVGDTSTRYYAKLDKIHPSYTEENDVILYDVVFNVANPDGVFLPAMNTQVFFVLAKADGVLALPLNSLTSEQKRASQITVGVLGKNGRQEMRVVDLGVRTRLAVEVKSGLSEGETIITRPDAPVGTASGSGRRFNMGPRI
jgi:macrolide-specific efflux system membrane fusion protein